MKIDDLEELEWPDIRPINEVHWKGREVEKKTIDPRIAFIRNLVFVYLYYYLVNPRRIHAFEQRLLQELWGDEPQSLRPESFSLKWAVHPIARCLNDPRIDFIRQIVFTYYYHMVVYPEKLPELEAKLLKILFKD